MSRRWSGRRCYEGISTMPKNQSRKTVTIFPTVKFQNLIQNSLINPTKNYRSQQIPESAYHRYYIVTKNVSLTPVYTWMTRDAADLPRHPSFAVAPATRLMTARVENLPHHKNQPYPHPLESVIPCGLGKVALHRLAREDPCQTLAKSLTDAGRGVFDMKGLVWYGGVEFCRSWIGNGLALFIKIGSSSVNLFVSSNTVANKCFT